MNWVRGLSFVALSVVVGCAVDVEDATDQAEPVAESTLALEQPDQGNCVCETQYEYRTRMIMGELEIEDPDRDGDGDISDDAGHSSQQLIRVTCSGEIHNQSSASVSSQVALAGGKTMSHGVTATNNSSWTAGGSGSVEFWLGPVEITLGGEGSKTWGEGESTTIQELVSEVTTTTHNVTVPPQSCVRYCAQNYKKTDGYDLRLSRIDTTIYERRSVRECRRRGVHICGGPFYGPWEEISRTDVCTVLGTIHFELSYDHNTLSVKDC